MNVILIGAGRGQRLMPLTEREPKSFVAVAGVRILDWTLEAFRQNALDKFVFIGGYKIDLVRKNYPEFNMLENKDWANNNILFSLIHAREYMKDGFYATYTDTLFRHNAVKLLKDSPHDITIVMDTLWRSRYRYRTQHPETDGEKMRAIGNKVAQISRDIPASKASGEFTGVLKMTRHGATQFLEFYDQLYARYSNDGIFVENKPFRMAYVIHQLELMIQAGITVHCVSVPGQYHEIDTVEDYYLASKDWANYAQS